MGRTIFLLGWSRVAEFEGWKHSFDEERDAQRAAGLELVHLWQDLEDPSGVFFLFQAQTIALARAFLERPQAERTGVLAAEGTAIHFVTLREGERDAEPLPPVRGLR